MAERRYRMTRIQRGDYLFLANDGKSLWRVYAYDEDGSLDSGARGTFWAAARFDGTVDQAQRLMDIDPDEFLSWGSWEHWTSVCRTRAEAEQAALQAVPA